VGLRTYSALGVLWGQRLLSHSWSDVWGGNAHPVDPEAEGEISAEFVVDIARQHDLAVAEGETFARWLRFVTDLETRDPGLPGRITRDDPIENDADRGIEIIVAGRPGTGRRCGSCLSDSLGFGFEGLDLGLERCDARLVVRFQRLDLRGQLRRRGRRFGLGPGTGRDEQGR